METKVRAMQPTTHSGGPSKREEIKVLLAKLAIRRQAKMGELEFAVFSDDLMPYELTIIETALNLLSSKPRAEGETAFPDIATILDAVRAVIRASKPSAEKMAKDAWDAHVAKCMAEGIEAPDPELQALIAKLNARLSL